MTTGWLHLIVADLDETDGWDRARVRHAAPLARGVALMLRLRYLAAGSLAGYLAATLAVFWRV